MLREFQNPQNVFKTCSLIRFKSTIIKHREDCTVSCKSNCHQLLLGQSLGICLKSSQCGKCSAILANCSVDNPTETNGAAVSGYIAKNSRTKYYYKLAYLSVQFETDDEIFPFSFITKRSGFIIIILITKQCCYYISLFVLFFILQL